MHQTNIFFFKKIIFDIINTSKQFKNIKNNNFKQKEIQILGNRCFSCNAKHALKLDNRGGK
jgi:hypothetical protein